ncbi:MAG: CoA-binding protein [Candidatus Cloacimonetes bacterium]|nr:CoA-binding protein [Candidatus Cloacimonadota bacterium]
MREVLSAARRVAIIGIKPESRAGAPAFYVPKYLQDVGYEVIPVPVYYPDVTTILGEPVYRRLTEIPGDIDLVVVFRRSEDVPKHVDEILEKKPGAVWLQLGIRNDEAAARWAAAGIKVVQDRCSMVEHRNLVG